MRILRLSNEYECYPTWIDEDGLENIDPAALEIPADLAARIDAWDERYQATYNPEDPASSGFSDVAEAAAFMKEGKGLCRELEDAVAGVYVVEYRELKRDHRPQGK